MREVLAAASSSLILPTPTLHPHSHSHINCGPQPKSNNIFRRNKQRSLNVDTPPLLSTIPWETGNGHILKYYVDLASTLAESGKLQVLLSIAESLIDSGVKPCQFASLLNVNLVSEGFRRMISGGNLENVIELLCGFKKIGIGATQLFDELAMEALRQECRRIMFKCNDAQVIVSLMATVQGLELPAKYLLRTSDVIRFCVNKQDSNAAIMYAQIFPHSQELFCSIMTEFGKKRDLGSALNVFEASKQKQDIPNMYAYRTIIDVCGFCGDYSKSRSVYEELLASNFTPNVYVFNSVMNANARDLGYTLRVYKHMKKVGAAADLASYNILLKACCISGRVDHAKEIYNEVIGLESAGVFKLDVFTYSTMIKVFADAKMWQMAVHIKEDMLLRGVVPNAVTWSSLISACANAGVVEKAFQVFDDMILAGCEPNSQCCNVLLHACVESRQYDRAFRLFNSWKKNGIPKADRIFHTAEKETFSNNDENIVRPSLQHESLAMRCPFIPTTTTYNILMKACGTDYFRAKALMDEMKLEGLSPDEISWSIFIDIVGSSKNGKGALQILRSMHHAGVQPDVVTYTTAIKVCVKHQDVKSAFSLFAEMKRYQIKPNLVTYNTLLRARRRYGSLQEVQQCLALYQDMRKAGYKPNDYYLKQLIEEWCEGVIQNSNQPKGHFTSQSNTLRPESLLIERVAERLQDSNAESLCIDLRGLTKIEARIMVLAVLRMIKEKYSPGDSLKDDLSIILEDEESETDEDTNRRKGRTTEAIVELVQRDLGLEVLPRETRIEHDTPESDDLLTHPNEEEVLISNDPPSSKLMHHTRSRRPANVQRLTISKGSLIYWLQRRGNVSSSAPIASSQY